MQTHQRKLLKAVLVILGYSFGLGIVLGSCSLGMRLPVALFEMATGQ